MLHEVVDHLKKPTSLEKIYFVLYDSAALAEFEKARAEAAKTGVELLRGSRAGQS